jgi:serine protease inhibitor
MKIATSKESRREASIIFRPGSLFKFLDICWRGVNGRIKAMLSEFLDVMKNTEELWYEMCSGPKVISFERALRLVRSLG